MIILCLYNRFYKDVTFVNILFFKKPRGQNISEALYSGGQRQDHASLIMLRIFTEILIVLSELSPWSNQLLHLYN